MPYARLFYFLHFPLETTWGVGTLDIPLCTIKHNSTACIWAKGDGNEDSFEKSRE